MSQTYPPDVLQQKAIDLIREQSAKAEKDTKLTKSLLNLAIENKWFRTYIPAAYGGVQMQLPEALQLHEALAWADGGFGWMVNHCALAGWSLGFADAEAASELLANEKALICGNALDKGKATKNGTTVEVTGAWLYTSGAADATAFVADCTMESEKDSVALLLRKEEINVEPDGYVMGLLGAEKLDIQISKVKVPENRLLCRTSESVKVKGPLYHFPYEQLAESIISVTLAGMTQHFLDLCTALFAANKNKDGVLLSEDLTVQETLRKQSQKFNDARTKLYYAVELSWRAVVNGQKVKPAILYKVSSSAADLSRRARECADALYPYCGLQAADRRSEINRVWRDLHTASLYSIALAGYGAE